MCSSVNLYVLFTCSFVLTPCLFVFLENEFRTLTYLTVFSTYCNRSVGIRTNPCKETDMAEKSTNTTNTKLVVSKVSSELISIGQELKESVIISTKTKYSALNPLSPTKYISSRLSKFSELCNQNISKEMTAEILNIIKDSNMYTILRDLIMLTQEQSEIKAVGDFISFFLPSKIVMTFGAFSVQDRIMAFQQIMDSYIGHKIDDLDNYHLCVSKELEMLTCLQIEAQHFTIMFQNRVLFSGSMPNLLAKKVTFVGAGLPLSGVLINIFTGAKINLIDIDPIAMENNATFLQILHGAGIISINDFNLINANGKDLIYSSSEGGLQTDILHLASALSNEVKFDIFKKIAKENDKHIIVIDRYVSGIYKLFYESKVENSKIPEFKTFAKMYPDNIYAWKVDSAKNKSDIKITSTNFNSVNSSRLLKLI